MLWVVSQKLIEKHGYSDDLYPPAPLEDGSIPSPISLGVVLILQPSPLLNSYRCPLSILEVSSLAHFKPLYYWYRSCYMCCLITALLVIVSLAGHIYGLRQPTPFPHDEGWASYWQKSLGFGPVIWCKIAYARMGSIFRIISAINQYLQPILTIFWYMYIKRIGTVTCPHCC